MSARIRVGPQASNSAEYSLFSTADKIADGLTGGRLITVCGGYGGRCRSLAVLECATDRHCSGGRPKSGLTTRVITLCRDYMGFSMCRKQ